MNLCFIYGCRPSAGVKANTDMVQNILLALTQNADRVNAKVLIPQAFEYLSSNDAQFETVTSSRIQTVMLFYIENLVTHSIGIVFYHNKTLSKGIYNDELQNSLKYNAVYPCLNLLKKALKLDQVHTFGDLSLSQLVEKLDFLTEKAYYIVLKDAHNPE